MNGSGGLGGYEPPDGSNVGSNFRSPLRSLQPRFVLEPSTLETRWLARTELRGVLRSVSQAWFDNKLRSTSENLGMIRREVWDAECRLQPFPDIAVASLGESRSESESESAVGLLCGTRAYGNKYFFLQHLALHPACPFDEPEALTIGTTLITAAIDLSVEMGCYGWLATAPSSPDKAYWVKLGFAKYDPFTYRRMGYFN